MTQAFTSPITSRLKGGLFNPLEFNPYLLFDAQTSMLGELEAPTLDLDASDESTLDVITATRAGVATYTDLHGTIKTASADTVRVDWSLGYPAMLIEPSATNLITQTDFSAGWSLAGSATIEQTTEPTPLPTQTALRIKSNGGLANGRYQASYAYSGTSTASVYIKWDGVDTRFRINRGVSNSSSYFDVNEGEVTLSSSVADSYSIQYHGDGWWRVSNTATNPTWIQLYADGLNGTGSILVALPQHEAGPVATSFIPTSGSAVTRNADNLQITGSNFTDFFNSGGDGTFYAEFVPRDVLSEQWYLLSGQNYNARIMYTNIGNAGLNAYDGVTTRSYGQDMVANQINRAAFSYTTTTQEASLDGSSTAALASNGNYTNIYLLNFCSPINTQQLNGHLKRLLYWPTHSSSL